MNCSACPNRAIFTSPTYCKEHFIAYIESKITATIKQFNLIDPNEKIAVAVSGGKDSLTTLYMLHKLCKNVTAISIDEGIPGYRDQTLEDMKTFCEQYDIPHEIHSFKDNYNTTLTAMLDKGAPSCRSCGVMRRHVLNKAAQKFDKLATGHNLDDECQNFMMNLLKGNLLLCAMLGPTTGITKRKGFTQRIKPLYLCTEKEIATYAFVKNFPIHFKECPHAELGLRSKVRDALNALESQQSGSKRKIVEYFLSILPALKESYISNDGPSMCTNCGQPSQKNICNACKTEAAYAN